MNNGMLANFKMVFLGETEREKDGKKTTRVKFHDPVSNEVFEFYVADENSMKDIKQMKMYSVYTVVLRISSFKGDINVRFVTAAPESKTVQGVEK